MQQPGKRQTIDFIFFLHSASFSVAWDVSPRHSISENAGENILKVREKIPPL
jgi:hypothetical protein